MNTGRGIMNTGPLTGQGRGPSEEERGREVAYIKNPDGGEAFIGVDPKTRECVIVEITPDGKKLPTLYGRPGKEGDKG